MKKGLILIWAILETTAGYSQNFDCAEVFVWLKETMETNDAGFQYAIDQKGEDAYRNQVAAYYEKVQSITDKAQCAETLRGWLKFFRKGHLWFGINSQQNQVVSATQKDNETIRKQFKNRETFPYKKNEFNNYLSKITEPSIEGIWSTPPYTIGVRKVGEEYIGFIIEADGVYWSTSQVKFKIRNENNTMKATYYRKDHTPIEINEVALIGSNYLKLDQIYLKRVQPGFPVDEPLDRHFRFQETKFPLFEKLDEQTVILRIPSFEGYAKKDIDSLLDANHHLITSTENLIIDLRFNGGGNDSSFEKLLPIIYTNPIRKVGVEFLSTPLNNQRMLDFINNPMYGFDEDKKKWAKTAYDTLEKNLGRFVSLDSTVVSIQTFDTIYPFPKNVGILINQGNGSTTEQFLLAAKQSKKVKLLGTTTFGMLDISNMYFVNSPCNDFELGYSLSRSKRIPHFTIDNIGIQPDYYFDKLVSKYEWIDFAAKILTTH